MASARRVTHTVAWTWEAIIYQQRACCWMHGNTHVRSSSMPMCPACRIHTHPFTPKICGHVQKPERSSPQPEKHNLYTNWIRKVNRENLINKNSERKHFEATFQNLGRSATESQRRLAAKHNEEHRSSTLKRNFTTGSCDRHARFYERVAPSNVDLNLQAKGLRRTQQNADVIWCYCSVGRSTCTILREGCIFASIFRRAPPQDTWTSES